MKRVLVIGDVIADVYRECVFKKMCPDAPEAQALIEIDRETRPGGAANVAVNVASLAPDIAVDLIGLIDQELSEAIAACGHRVDVGPCVHAWSRNGALRKERVVLGGRTVVRVDSPGSVCERDATRVASALRLYLSVRTPDLIVLSDYAAGTVGAECLSLLLEHRERLLVDTKLSDLSVFGSGGRRTLLAKLNEGEWEAALQVHHSPEEHFAFLVVTRGPCGADLIFRRTGERLGSSVCQSMRIREHAVDEVDVCGCGDTFIAGLAAAMAHGRDAYSAVQFANAAAATVVSMPRTAVAVLGATVGLLGWNL